MSPLYKFKLAALALIELALLALFAIYLTSTFGNVLTAVAALVGVSLLLTGVLFWKLQQSSSIQKSSSLIISAFFMGIAGFLFPLALGPHATLGMLLLGLVAQVACLLAASYFALIHHSSGTPNGTP
jgi:hypothetical protein